MNIDEIITLDDNKEYLILDKTTIDEEEYLYAVGVDKEENVTDEFVYLFVEKEDEDYYVEEIDDEDTIQALASIFTANYLANSENEEQDA